MITAILMMLVVTAPGQEEFGWESLFNGIDLDGWSGDQEVWTVEDGTITGSTTRDNPLSANSYLFWKDRCANFELVLEFRIESGNSGVQYRSERTDTGDAIGYQADMDRENRYTGILYDAGGRGILMERGTHCVIDSNGNKLNIGAIGNPDELVEHVRTGEWNTYRIIADGPRLVHQINGITMMDLIDQHPRFSRTEGLFALQLHTGEPMKVQFRNIRLRRMDEPGDHEATQSEGIGRQTIPAWIWIEEEATDDQRCILARSFDLDTAVASASLTITCDNEFIAMINGHEVANGDDWASPVRVDGVEGLVKGANRIEVECLNHGGPAGLAAILEIELADGSGVEFVTDLEWEGSIDRARWSAVHSHGRVDDHDGPWHDMFQRADAPSGSSIILPDGFRATRLHSAGPGEGSWVCMTFDDVGRLIISSQYGRMYRVMLEDEDRVKVEPLDVPIGMAQGLVYSNGSLYANVTRKAEDGGGLYRLTDTDGDDQFDEVERLAAFGNGSEHGNHGIVEGPDGSIWIVNGNYTSRPDRIAGSSPHAHWAEDVLDDRIWDPSGHAVGIKAPAGSIYRTDPDGNEFVLYAGGLRNPYDLAFNADGELFTYDADMEYDMGLPWYREPTVYHVVSGGEYGWRGGTGKWEQGLPDSAGFVCRTDASSPTGIIFGHETNFPEPWRSALFLGDWAWGRILAVNMEPDGATYTGEWTEFARGTPLNVTDIAISGDGSMFIITGGRRTQTGLYRIDYVGDEQPGDLNTNPDPEAARLRRTLEEAHGNPSDQGLRLAMEHLGSEDFSIAYAARISLEHHPIEDWQDLVLEETHPTSALNGLLAMSRVGNEEHAREILYRLGDFAHAGTDLSDRITIARIIKIVMMRHDGFEDFMAGDAIDYVNEWYPSDDRLLNRQLSELLIRLGSPKATERTVDLLETSPTQEEQIHLARMLSHARTGWTPDLRSRYFRWVKRARGFTGGNSFKGFLERIEERAREGLSPDEKAMLATWLPSVESVASIDLLEDHLANAEFVTNWQVADLENSMDGTGGLGSVDRGRRLFTEVLCIHCHRFSGEGGATGPDLTASSGRFSRRDLLRAIIEPSHEVSDQYASWLIRLDDGNEFIGRIVSIDDETLEVDVDPFTPRRVRLPLSRIISREQIPTSSMPAGLLNSLEKEEVMDLMAYLLSGR